jgi:predicted membrane-bound spermidine synthase
VAGLLLLRFFGCIQIAVLGGGMNGSIAERLLRIQPLNYVEIDPALIDIYRQLFPRESTVFADPRVHVHETDGRLFLKTAARHMRFIALNQFIDLCVKKKVQIQRKVLLPGRLSASRRSLAN